MVRCELSRVQKKCRTRVLRAFYRRTVLSGRRKEGCSALFFELFFLGRSESRRCAQRFAVIVERQIAHVQRDGAGRRLLVDRSEERRVGKECRSRWSPYH